MAVAITERFKQESMYRLSNKTKKETEMAVVEMWLFVDIHLYNFYQTT